MNLFMYYSSFGFHCFLRFNFPDPLLVPKSGFNKRNAENLMNFLFVLFVLPLFPFRFLLFWPPAKQKRFYPIFPRY